MKRQFTATEAGRVTGKGRSTITRHMKSGKLSFDLNDAGYRVVEASELIRVYGDDVRFEDGGGETEQSNTKQGVSQTNFDVEKLLEALQDANKREREQYAARIERLEKDFDEAKEHHRHALRLLEDKSARENDLTKTLGSLREKQALSEREIRSLKKRLVEKKRRRWWNYILAT